MTLLPDYAHPYHLQSIVTIDHLNSTRGHTGINAPGGYCLSHPSDVDIYPAIRSSEYNESGIGRVVANLAALERINLG